MTKIQSGIWKGRILSTPPSSLTRPSSSLVKKAFFDIFDVEEALFVDIFAGSGAVGIEALSRGAKKAIFIEKNAPCIKILSANLSLLKAEDDLFQIIRADAFKVVDKLAPCAPIDHIFIDPPYEIEPQELHALIEKLWPLLKSGGFIHLEQSKRALLHWRNAQIEGVLPLPIRTYGDTLVISWQKL